MGSLIRCQQCIAITNMEEIFKHQRERCANKDMGARMLDLQNGSTNNIVVSPTPPDLLDVASNARDAAAEKTNDGIELVGFGDFSTKPPKLREPIIEGLLRRGETANIIASTKVGKSWMAADLGMAVATGTKWLKQLNTEAGKVVYIKLELHPETFAGRLRRIAEFREYDIEGLNSSFYAICLRGTGKTIFSLGSIVDALPSDVSVIVLDAWYRLLPSGMSKNDNAAMVGLYNHLDAYAKLLSKSRPVV